MTSKLSKNFHGVGNGPLSKILAVKLKKYQIFICLAYYLVGQQSAKLLNRPIAYASASARLPISSFLVNNITEKLQPVLAFYGSKIGSSRPEVSQ